MGILDSVKNKFFKRRDSDDISDIKTHVIGDTSLDANDPFAPPDQTQQNDPLTPPDPFTPAEQQPPPPAQQPLKRTDAMQEPGFGQPVQNEQPLKFEDDLGPPTAKNMGIPDPIGQQPDTSRDYEIRDRLHMIESQLSAIRSQTETINERLKNIEMRMSGKRF